jgi:2-hydroxychromene-2-carboxylate isomerase
VTAPTIEFWYDFASTYSYPAAMTVARRAAAKGVAVTWRPFLLGPLFHAQQGLTDSPFNVQKEKGAWMWRDLERTCARLGLPLQRPTVFPRSSLNAARAALACEAAGLDVGTFSRAVFDANFARDQDISDVGVIGEILAEIDYSGAPVLDHMRSDAVKQALKDQTARAMSLGLFGAPSFTTPDGELFWGHDRLDEAVEWAESSPTT